MKNNWLIFLLLISHTALASIDSMKQVLDQKEVKNLVAELKSRSFELSRIDDVYAESGNRPRCPCEALKLTFTKNELVVGAIKKSIEIYSISTSGQGKEFKVKIETVK